MSACRVPLEELVGDYEPITLLSHISIDHEYHILRFNNDGTMQVIINGRTKNIGEYYNNPGGDGRYWNFNEHETWFSVKTKNNRTFVYFTKDNTTLFRYRKILSKPKTPVKEDNWLD